MIKINELIDMLIKNKFIKNENDYSCCGVHIIITDKVWSYVESDIGNIRFNIPYDNNDPITYLIELFYDMNIHKRYLIPTFKQIADKWLLIIRPSHKIAYTKLEEEL